MSLIKFKNVSHIYSQGYPFEFSALKNVSIEIETGEFVAIIGHTGSGKSTLVQHINGLLKPTIGSLEVCGYEITSKKKQKGLMKIRETAGLVFQFPEAQLFEETIKKDIEFGPKNFGVSEEERTKRSKELIKVVGLDENYLSRSPFELSGGQKRRVAIAGILAMEPEVLILDEPTAGLDPTGKKEMLQMIDRLNKEGRTIILVTHDMDDVLEYASRVIVMSDGEVIKDSTPQEVFASKEMLDGMNINLPTISEFIHQLNKKGYNIPFSVSTIDELTDIIGRGK